MNTLRQNIGNRGQSQNSLCGPQVYEITKKTLNDTKTVKVPSPLVGQSRRGIATKLGHVPPPKRETPEQRWRRFIDEWKASNHPNPNRMLTINFNKAMLDAHISEGGTISSFKTRFLDYMRRICRRTGHPWLAAWVIEVRNNPHIHILMWIPEGSDLETQIWRWLAKRFPVALVTSDQNRIYMPGDNSGSPIHMSYIDEDRFYQKTDRCGLNGLSDYLAKAITLNSQRKRGRAIGRIVGRTKDLSRASKLPAEVKANV